MYDYSRRLDLSQAWLPNFVLKISQHFLCTSYKNSKVFFCTWLKTFSKSLKCYQSKRANSCSLLHLCSDLAKNCFFFGKLYALVIFGMFYTKSSYLCKLYHIIHIFMQYYPVISTAKTVYYDERTAALSWKCSSSFIIQQQKGNFDLQEWTGFHRLLNSDKFPSQVLNSSRTDQWSIRLALQSIPCFACSSKKFCRFFHRQKDPRRHMPAGILALYSKDRTISYLPSSSRSMISRASGACLSIFSGKPK